MSLLSYVELLDILKQGVIENSSPDFVKGSSIDIHLGDSIYRESLVEKGHVIYPYRPDTQVMEPSDSWLLKPGDFVLTNTREIFHIPNDLTFQINLKSSIARLGIDHSLAGWGDPGFSDASLTLELHNCLKYSSIQLIPGMPIAQVIFFRITPVPEEHSYKSKGQYNKQKAAQPSKGIQ